MKRIIALILATLICVFSFAGCGKDPADDLANVEKAGKLVVGITSFAPMDFKDDNGEWVGFDADLAKAFAKELGVEVEFREIEWDNKVLELDSYKVDVIWNGMTLTEEVTAAMDCTNAYCNNQQVIIVPKDKAADFATPDSIKDITVAVEKGSAGQTEATAKGAKIKEVAKENKVEIVENKPLARMLYYNVELGSVIPPELYKAVADILAMVYKMQGKI